MDKILQKLRRQYESTKDPYYADLYFNYLNRVEAQDREYPHLSEPLTREQLARIFPEDEINVVVAVDLNSIIDSNENDFLGLLCSKILEEPLLFPITSFEAVYAEDNIVYIRVEAYLE